MHKLAFDSIPAQNTGRSRGRRTTLAIALTILTLLSTACLPGSRRGASMGFDYFVESKTCNTDQVKESDRDKYLQIYNAIRIAYAQDTAQRKNARLVVTGDSIAALFMPPLMDKYMPGVNAANRGIGGDTVGLLTTRIEADVLALRPRAVAISIGGNDILQGRCIDHTLDETRKLIQTIKAKAPGTKVLMTSVPPTLTWKANQVVPFYNWQLKYITEEFSGVEYIDLWRVMSERNVPQLAEPYHATLPGGGTDVIHFGEEGYRVWGELLKPYAR